MGNRKLTLAEKRFGFRWMTPETAEAEARARAKEIGKEYSPRKPIEVPNDSWTFELGHPLSYSGWIERLALDPYKRFFWSIDLPDADGADAVRPVAMGVSLSADEAMSEVEVALERLFSGPRVVESAA